jgi:hypothetical protein
MSMAKADELEVLEKTLYGGYRLAKLFKFGGRMILTRRMHNSQNQYLPFGQPDSEENMRVCFKFLSITIYYCIAPVRVFSAYLCECGPQEESYIT